MRLWLSGRHGDDRRPGGDALQRVEVAATLRDFGFDAVAVPSCAEVAPTRGDVVLLHDLMLPRQWGDLPERADRAGARIFLWPLLHDTTLYDRRGRGALSALTRHVSGLGIVAARAASTVTALRRRVQRIANTAEGVVASGPVEQELLERWFGLRASLHIPPSLPDAEPAPTTAAVDETEALIRPFGATPFALCVGRVEPLKGCLDILAVCRRERVPILFVGATTADRHPAFTRTMVRNGGKALVGPRSTEVVHHLMRRATVHISFSWAEVAGRATLEAARAGAGVIVTDTGEWPARFRGLDGVSAVPRGDTAALRSALRERIAAGRPYDGALALAARTLCWPRTLTPLVERLRG